MTHRVITTPRHKDTVEADLVSLREDLRSLREDVGADLRNVRKDLSRLARDAANTAADEAASRTRRAADAVDHEVRDHPVRSALIAFGVGLGATLLLGRRRPTRT